MPELRKVFHIRYIFFSVKITLTCCVVDDDVLVSVIVTVTGCVDDDDDVSVLVTIIVIGCVVDDDVSVSMKNNDRLF